MEMSSNDQTKKRVLPQHQQALHADMPALAAPIDRTLPHREHPWQASSRSLLDLAPTICQNTASV